MFSRIKSIGIFGMESYMIEVEADVEVEAEDGTFYECRFLMCKM